MESDASGPRTPGVVRAAVVLTFFNTWVLVEETVIDRYGLWEYLPYYRYGKLCAWDIGALILIVWFTHRVFSQKRAGRIVESGARRGSR
jgi:hypothetical protein